MKNNSESRSLVSASPVSIIRPSKGTFTLFGKKEVLYTLASDIKR